MNALLNLRSKDFINLGYLGLEFVHLSREIKTRKNISNAISVRKIYNRCARINSECFLSAVQINYLAY